MNAILKSLLPSRNLGWNHVRARCGLSTCHNKLLMRPAPHKGAGIRIGQDWYCGVDCFVVGARTPLAALAARRVMEMPRNPRLSLGLALLSKELLTEEQLRLATELSREHGESLETTLQVLGWANEKQLAAARSAQWGYPVYRAGNVPVESSRLEFRPRYCGHSPPRRSSFPRARSVWCSGLSSASTTAFSTPSSRSPVIVLSPVSSRLLSLPCR